MVSDHVCISLGEVRSDIHMFLPPAGHTPDHVPLHTPGHVGGGAIAPTLGPGADHGQGLVLTTGEEEGVRDGGDRKRKGHCYWDNLIHCLFSYLLSSRSYSPYSRRRHYHSRSPFSNRKRHDGNRVSRT